MRIIIDDGDGEEFVIPAYLVETRPTEPYVLFFLLQIQYFQCIFRYRLLWGQVSGAAWDIRGRNPTGPWLLTGYFSTDPLYSTIQAFFMCASHTLCKGPCKLGSLKMENKLP